MLLSGSKKYLLLLFVSWIACSNPNDSESYVAFGDSHIAKFDFDYYFSNKQIDNQATNGLTSSEIETRIRSHQTEATRIILHAGTNDLIKAFNTGITEDDFVNQMEIDLLNLLDACNTFKEVIIIGSLPVHTDYFGSPFYNLERIENILLTECTRRTECKFISSQFLWDEAGFLDRNYTTDLIHLNADGYQQLSAAIYHEMD